MPLNNTIQSIKDYFTGKDGLQRSNRFSVSFSNIPQTISRYQDREYLADEFLLQQRVIDQLADNLTGYGIGRLLPRRQRFANGFNLSFPVAGDNKIVLFFNDWFNLLYSGGYSSGGNYPAPFSLGYYDDVVQPVTVDINLLDMNGNPKTRFTFNEVMPVELLPIKMAQNVQNEYLRIALTFNYRDFIYKTV